MDNMAVSGRRFTVRIVGGERDWIDKAGRMRIVVRCRDLPAGCLSVTLPAYLRHFRKTLGFLFRSCAIAGEERDGVTAVGEPPREGDPVPGLTTGATPTFFSFAIVPLLRWLPLVRRRTATATPSRSANRARAGIRALSGLEADHAGLTPFVMSSNAVGLA